MLALTLNITKILRKGNINVFLFFIIEGGENFGVVFENCYLTDEEKRTAAEIALKVRPDFIKTSTGFGTGGATVEDVRLMKSVVGDAVKVKAAGGIRDFDTAVAMVEAGAERLGTSAGVELMKHFENL